MQPKPKANSVVTTGYDEALDQLWWTVTGVGKLTLEINKLSEAVIARAFREGLSDRIADKAAKSRDSTTGLPASPQVKYDAMAELVAHYETGTEEWSLRAAGGFDNTPLIRLAIMRVKNYDEKQLESFLTKYSAAQHGGDVKAAMKYLATGAEVGAAMLAIKQERLGQAAIDADAALRDWNDAE